MARLSAFVMIVFAIFIGVFAMSRRNAPVKPHATLRGPAATMGADGPPGLAEQGAANTAARQGMPVGANGYRMRSALTIPDQRLAVYLRRAYVEMMSSYAETGQWPADVTKLQSERPANTQLHIVSTSAAGMKLTAVDSKAERQCDLFTGDSAKMAFGYAYDPSMPACGKLR